MRVKELKLKQKRREERKEDYMQTPGEGETRSGNWKNLSRSIEFFLLLCYINRYLKNITYRQYVGRQGQETREVWAEHGDSEVTSIYI